MFLMLDILYLPVPHPWSRMRFKIGLLCRWCFLVRVVFGWWLGLWWKIQGYSLWFYWRIRATQVNINSGTFLVAPLQLCCHPFRWFVPHIILSAWKRRLLLSLLSDKFGQKTLAVMWLTWCGLDFSQALTQTCMTGSYRKQPVSPLYSPGTCPCHHLWTKIGWKL